MLPEGEPGDYSTPPPIDAVCTETDRILIHAVLDQRFRELHDAMMGVHSK